MKDIVDGQRAYRGKGGEMERENPNEFTEEQIYNLSKYSSSKKNLEYILKKKIRKLTEEKKIRYELYQEINHIIFKLEKLKLLNDKVFTESKINSLLNQARSKNYIKQYLIRKGVENKLADEQIFIYFNNNNLENIYY